MLLAVARSFYSLFLRSSYLFGSRRAFSPLSRAPSFSLLLLLLLFSTPIVPTLRVDTPEFLPMHARTHARTDFSRLKISRRSSKRFSRKRCCNAIDFFFTISWSVVGRGCSHESGARNRGRRYVDDRSDNMASGYANTRLSGRRFNGEGTGSGEPCGPRIPPEREVARRWDRDGPSIFSFFWLFEQFVPSVDEGRARRNIRGSACVYIISKKGTLISILIDRFNFGFRRLILN